MKEMCHKHNTYVFSREDTLHIHKNEGWEVSLPGKKQTNINLTFIVAKNK